MLDFYSIKDDQPTPSYPEKLDLKFVGDLDDITFGNLQNKGIIDRKLDYYSDFRLSRSVIQLIRQTISDNKLESDTDVKKIVLLLDLADKYHSGLIAYGD
ncbi:MULTISPECIES: hypothetical protein [Chryseobacterium]|uniref:hypothetical protein n=1 Tax=Chryseobacterium TaxID=59732 RepID=UPI001BE853A7|nr:MULTISPECIES: hypothetical protein [Chryseobacterium]MBT2623006.1 hypothetical protein [Chryseobacterium sp. ISL-6]